MASIFADKKPFQKKYKVFDTEKDFGLPQSHKFALWDDPSRPVLNGLLGIVTNDLSGATEEEKIENHHMWCEYVSEMVLDSDIEGVSFDTPEDVEEAFDNPAIDSNFLFLVIYFYINYLFETVEVLKKTIASGNGTRPSGESEKQTPQKQSEKS